MKVKDNAGFSLKNLIITILFIAIIIFLIFWIASMRKEIKANQRVLESVTQSVKQESTKNTEFDDNLEALKDASVK